MQTQNISVISTQTLTMTGTTAINFDAYAIRGASVVAFGFAWTGTPTGTWKVQCACTNSTPASTDWCDVSSATFSAAGAAAAGAINLANVGYSWVRLVYTNASGTGAVTNAFVCAKG